MRRALVIALLSAAHAHADSSVAAPLASDPLAGCTMKDAPYEQMWNSDRVIRLRPAKDAHLIGATAHHLLYASRFPPNSPDRIILVDVAGRGSPRAFPRDNAAIVEDERGELVGLLSYEPFATESTLRRLQLYSPTGEPRWRTLPAGGFGDSATTLVVGDTLVVALFRRIATGAELIALDLKTGRQKWKAEVAQLNVEHSQYLNDVALELRSDVEHLQVEIVMRGYEAGGCYRQTFLLATGQRLSTRLHPTP